MPRPEHQPHPPDAGAGRLGGRLEVALAALLFSTGGAAIKAVSLGGLQVAGLRSLVAALAVALLAAVLPGVRLSLDRRSWLAAVAWAATMLLFVLANKQTTAASAVLLHSTAPLYVLLLGPWLLGEVVRRRDLPYMGSLALGLGLFFVGLDPVSATAPAPLAGNLLAAGSGLTWGLTLVALRGVGRAGAERGRRLGVALVANLLVAAGCLPWAPWPTGTGTGDWAILVYLGAFQIAGAYLLLSAGLRRVRALEGSLLLLLDPVATPVWAWWLHGERPGLWSLAGGAVIVAATVARTVLEARRERRRRWEPPGSSGGAPGTDRHRAGAAEGTGKAG